KGGTVLDLLGQLRRAAEAQHHVNSGRGAKLLSQFRKNVGEVSGSRYRDRWMDGVGSRLAAASEHREDHRRDPRTTPERVRIPHVSVAPPPWQVSCIVYIVF